MKKGKTYRKRAFLNPISTGDPSFVLAVADSSKGGTEAHGNYVLTLADFTRIIELEFPLASPLLRKRSLKKIELLADIINDFKNTIHTEAELIDKRRRK